MAFGLSNLDDDDDAWTSWEDNEYVQFTAFSMQYAEDTKLHLED